MKASLWALGVAVLAAAGLLWADDTCQKQSGCGSAAGCPAVAAANAQQKAGCCGNAVSTQTTAGASLGDAKCPISGEPVSADASIAYKGGKLYFCCPGCSAKFNANLEKYAAKANHQLAVTGQVVQVACPFTGGKLNPATKTKVAGVDVCFCCNNCKAKVAKAEAAKQIEMVFGKAFDKAFQAKKEKKQDKAA